MMKTQLGDGMMNNAVTREDCKIFLFHVEYLEISARQLVSSKCANKGSSSKFCYIPGERMKSLNIQTRGEEPRLTPT